MCLVLTPLVLEVTRQLRRNPLPYLLPVAMASNVGSVATITGNPQNMMIATYSGIGYARFAASLAPVAKAGLVLTVVVIIAWIYRGEFRGAAPLEVQPHTGHVYRPLMWKSLAASCATIVFFFAGWPAPKVAVIAGALLLVTRRIKPERIYREIDWSLLVMFVGLFIVIAGLEKTPLPRDLFAAATRYHLERTAPSSIPLTPG